MNPIAWLDIAPLAHVAGAVRVPGSKSITNRALLLAALAQGTTRLRGALDADDTQAMAAALAALGVNLARDGDDWQVQGSGGGLPLREAALDLGNAGTAMRPLAAVLAVLAARDGGRYQLAGSARMHERPIGDLTAALRAAGCAVQELGAPGCPPLALGSGTPQPLTLDEPLRVRGSVSSQFTSALLMALPLLAREQDVALEVDGPLVSEPYVAMTVQMMARFGVALRREGGARWVAPRGSTYRAPAGGVVEIDGDASAASYFLAAGALAAIAAPLHVQGVSADSLQGDVAFVDALRAMGAQVTPHPNGEQGGLAVQRGAWPLVAIDWDCTAIPDAAMTLAMLALYANGVTRLRGIASWRVKESDRIAVMADMLTALGAQVQASGDALAITPPPPGGWRAATIATHDDHRIAMCASLAAFNPQQLPLRLLEPACVNKTYPGYFDAFFGIAQPQPATVPVLTVDGPTASGKGTLAAALARALGFALLDSGALYRAAALAAHDGGVALDDAPGVAAIAAAMDLRFDADRVWLAGRDVSERLRLESTGGMASQISVHPAVRAALHSLQLAFARLPGLVADGRDMGTVVFPEAQLKVFLTASAQARAERRHAQLAARGVNARIDRLLADIAARDARDTSRASAPLKPAEGARLLDNSALTVEQSVAQVLAWWQARPPFGASPPQVSLV